MVVYGTAMMKLASFSLSGTENSAQAESGCRRKTRISLRSRFREPVLPAVAESGDSRYES